MKVIAFIVVVTNKINVVNLHEHVWSCIIFRLKRTKTELKGWTQHNIFTHKSYVGFSPQKPAVTKSKRSITNYCRTDTRKVNIDCICLLILNSSTLYFYDSLEKEEKLQREIVDLTIQLDVVRQKRNKEANQVGIVHRSFLAQQ